jgi:hypothetical protein
MTPYWFFVLLTTIAAGAAFVFLLINAIERIIKDRPNLHIVIATAICYVWFHLGLAIAFFRLYV